MHKPRSDRSYFSRPNERDGIGSRLRHDLGFESALSLPFSLSNFELGGCATCRVKNGNINANTTEKGIQLVTVKAPLDDGGQNILATPDKKPNLQPAYSPFVTSDGHPSEKEEEEEISIHIFRFE